MHAAFKYCRYLKAISHLCEIYVKICYDNKYLLFVKLKTSREELNTPYMVGVMSPLTYQI